MTIHEIESEALRLKPSDRARLAERLLDSLETLSDEENARKMTKLTYNLSRATPMTRAGLSEDIAEAALYLASDAGRFVNSHDLVVDGGRTSMFNEWHDDDRP